VYRPPVCLVLLALADLAAAQPPAPVDPHGNPLPNKPWTERKE